MFHVSLPLKIQTMPRVAKILQIINLFFSFAAIRDLISSMLLQAIGGLNTCLVELVFLVEGPIAVASNLIMENFIRKPMASIDIGFPAQFSVY
jgi:hypothetical protein